VWLFRVADVFSYKFQPILHFADVVEGKLASLGASWEQAGSSESGFAGRGETWFTGSGGSGFAARGETGFAGSSDTGFAGSKLVAVDLAWLVGVNLALLIAVNVALLVAVDMALQKASWLLKIWIPYKLTTCLGSGFASTTVTFLVSLL
jgi:hypothetical protein